jgi:hypothetical protein
LLSELLSRLLIRLRLLSEIVLGQRWRLHSPLICGVVGVVGAVAGSVFDLPDQLLLLLM